MLLIHALIENFRAADILFNYRLKLEDRFQTKSLTFPHTQKNVPIDISRMLNPINISHVYLLVSHLQYRILFTFFRQNVFIRENDSYYNDSN